MRSLLAPLIIGLVLSLAAVFAVQWTAVHVAIDTVMRNYIADELAQDSDELFGALAIKPGSDPWLEVTDVDPPFLTPSSGQYYEILDGREPALRSPSLARGSLPIAPVARGQRNIHDVIGANKQTLLLVATGYEFLGRPITIGVATDLGPIQTQYNALLSRYTKLSLVMFALLVVLQVGIVRIALAPLRRVEADVKRLERGEITQLGETVPAEVLPLVREVNRMLALLARRLSRSRESLGNLAHAMKAPLTVLTHMANEESIRRHPTLDAQMQEQLGLLRRRIDSELRRARIAGGRASGEVLGLQAEIEALIATLRKIHVDRNLDIASRMNQGLEFYGDREDLLELCGNLLDNACKWARSRVLISARSESGLVLTVEDDGPGCAPEDLNKIARRGVRMDEAVEGHGLGLAIAGDIASSYDAEMQLGRSDELGGFSVSVTFPLA